MAKGKKEKLSLEKLLEQALVKEDDMLYEVPGNWVWTRLIGGFAQCLDNYRKPINSSERARREGHIPYYGATGQVGWIDDFLTDEQLVLVGEDGAPFFDYIKDKSYIIEGKAWVNNHAHILKSFYGDYGNKYLMNYLNIFNYKGYVNGTTRLKLTQGSMNIIPIPLPPFAEQQRIVDVIESLFEKLDTAKELAQTALDSFENRKAAILHKAFTGELTAKWREENKTNENNILTDILKYYTESEVKKKIKNILECQDSKLRINDIENSLWYKCSIGAIGVVSNGSTPSRQNLDFWNGDISWVSSGEVRNNIIEITKERISQVGYDNSSVKILPVGTVLIAMIGEGKTRGQSAILNIDATINQNIAAIDVSHKKVESKFIWYWLQKQYQNNREKGNGTGPQALNCQRVRELDFVLPPLAEQKEIVRILDNLLENEQRSKELCDVIEKIDLMKKAILARAFRGELGTNNPEEESAIKLLKEVLQEKI